MMIRATSAVKAHQALAEGTTDRIFFDCPIGRTAGSNPATTQSTLAVNYLHASRSKPA